MLLLQSMNICNKELVTSCQLIIWVGVFLQELLEWHPSTAYSYNDVAVDELELNSGFSEHIYTISNTLEVTWQDTIFSKRITQTISKLHINWVILDRYV